MQALIKPNVGIRHLSHYVDMDLTGCDLDDPFPELSKESAGGSSRRYAIAAVAHKEKLTIRQTYERFLPSFGHTVMVGARQKPSPDQIEDWYRSGVCDGFNVHVGYQPDGLEARRRSCHPGTAAPRPCSRPHIVAQTCGERMGLDVPGNQFFMAARDAAE